MAPSSARSCTACRSRSTVVSRLMLPRSDGAAPIALALQVGRDALAQVGEDGAELGAVVHGVQIALERGLAADAHGLALGHHGALVPPPRPPAPPRRRAPPPPPRHPHPPPPPPAPRPPG